MSSQRGFTVVEFMVAVVLLSLLILSASALFVYQSETGRYAAQTMASGEALSMAIGLIAEDVMHAGFGLGGYGSDDMSGLAVWLDTPSSDSKSFTRLCVGNARNAINPDPSATKNLFNSTAVFTLTSALQGAAGLTSALSGNQLQSPLSPSEMGCLILDKAPNTLLFSRTDPPTFTSATSTYDYKVSPLTMQADVVYTPAVVYELRRVYGDKIEDGEAQKNALVRNGIGVDGKPQVLLGAQTDLRVSDFRIWAFFFDASGNRKWSPSPICKEEDGNFTVLSEYGGDQSVQTFPSANLTDLRWLEIWIGYQFKKTCEDGDQKDPNGVCWDKTIYRKTRVSPRNLRIQ